MRTSYNEPSAAIFGPRQRGVGCERSGPVANPRRLAASRAACAALMATAPLAAFAQIVPAPPPLQEAGGSTYRMFVRGAPIGTEQVAVTRTADGWTIASSGRGGAPIDVVGRRVP